MVSVPSHIVNACAVTPRHDAGLFTRELRSLGIGAGQRRHESVSKVAPQQIAPAHGYRTLENEALTADRRRQGSDGLVLAHAVLHSSLRTASFTYAPLGPGGGGASPLSRPPDCGIIHVSTSSDRPGRPRQVQRIAMARRHPPGATGFRNPAVSQERRTKPSASEG